MDDILIYKSNNFSMPKVCASKVDLLKKWIKDAKCLSTDGTVVYYSEVLIQSR